MNILITNIWLNTFGGTEVFVKELAEGFLRCNINVEVYTNQTGEVAEQIRNSGINVTDNVNLLKNTPDLIHAQHFIPAMDVISHFPDVPVVYFMHDRTHPIDHPPKYSRIIRYYAVDYNCLDRLTIDNGIPIEKTGVLFNWVDTSRFKLKKKYNKKPTKALVFSNYATENNYFKEIRLACLEMGIELDGIGFGLNNPENEPQRFLGNYDIVFGKAKAAMEAMAMGASVVLCDFMGLGEMVTTKNFDFCRKYNFGMKTLTRKITRELIIEEVGKYDVDESKEVSNRIRNEASFDISLQQIIRTYKELIRKDKITTTGLLDLDKKLINDYNHLKFFFGNVSSKKIEKENQQKFNSLSAQIDLLKNENDLLQQNLQLHKEQLKQREDILSKVVNSLSFKLGRILTFFPRFIKRSFNNGRV